MQLGGGLAKPEAVFGCNWRAEQRHGQNPRGANMEKGANCSTLTYGTPRVPLDTTRPCLCPQWLSPTGQNGTLKDNSNVDLFQGAMPLMASTMGTGNKAGSGGLGVGLRGRVLG